MQLGAKYQTPVSNVFALLPEEVWLQILDYIQDPSDMWACSKSTGALNYLVYSSTAIWTSLYLYKIIFLLYPRLSRKDMLTLRLVCKRWKSAVDYFLDRDQIKIVNFDTQKWATTIENLIRFQKVKIPITKRSNFRNMKPLIYYQNQFNALCLRPGIGSTIAVYGYTRKNQKFVRQFFKQSGAFIKNLCFLGDEFGSYNIYHYLPQLQKWTPNLEMLSVVGSFHSNDRNLHATSRNISISWLQNLRVLEIIKFRTQTNDIILELGTHLKNLEVLRLEICSNTTLLAIKKVNSPVTELSLKIKNSDINFTELLKAVEKFKETLKVLTISFPAVIQSPINPQFRVQFPKLETLHLRCIGNFLPFSVFLDLVKLRHLHLHHQGYESTQDWYFAKFEFISKEIWNVDSAVAESSVSVSRLWKHFPNLESVHVSQNYHKKQIYTRKRISNLRKHPCRINYTLAMNWVRVQICNLKVVVNLLKAWVETRLFDYYGVPIYVLIYGSYQMFGVVATVILGILLVFYMLRGADADLDFGF